MAKIIFAMNQSLDGFVDHDAFGPDDVLFRHFIEETRTQSALIYGRGLYEVMRYWDGDEWSQHQTERTPDLRAYAEAWRTKKKWVFSNTLSEVGPNAELVREDLKTFVARAREQWSGEVDLGGPVLAAALAGSGLIDEYQIYLHPVTVRQGRPFFVNGAPPLRLVRHETIGNAVRLTYTPAD